MILIINNMTCPDTLPSMKELIQEGGLPLSTAFQLVRPIVRLALQSSLNKNPEGLGSIEFCAPNLLKWHPFSQNMLDAIAIAAPEGGWQQNVSLEFLSIFWSLSMYDLYLPKTRYEAEIKRYRDKIAETEKAMAHDDEKTRTAKKSEITKLNATITALQEELNVQKKQVDTIKKILIAKKDGFFVGASKDIDQNKYIILESIVQHCVRPRLLMSPIDAVFCSHFFVVLHEIDTPKYNLVNYFDKFIKMVTPSIFCSTEYEASFLGHALNDMMSVLNRWATSQDNFINENGLRTGPYSKFLPLFSVRSI